MKETIYLCTWNSTLCFIKEQNTTFLLTAFEHIVGVDTIFTSLTSNL